MEEVVPRHVEEEVEGVRHLEGRRRSQDRQLRRRPSAVLRTTANSQVLKLARPAQRAEPSSTFKYAVCNTSSASWRSQRQQLSAQAKAASCRLSSCARSFEDIGAGRWI